MIHSWFAPRARQLGQDGRGGGIRTPTRGFGDRWSAVKPTPLDSQLSARTLQVCGPDIFTSYHCNACPDPAGHSLLDLFVPLVLPAMRAEFLELQPLRRGLLVLRPGIIPVLALRALKRDDFTRHDVSPT